MWILSNHSDLIEHYVRNDLGTIIGIESSYELYWDENRTLTLDRRGVISKGGTSDTERILQRPLTSYIL
jgi:hypothetical protein